MKMMLHFVRISQFTRQAIESIEYNKYKHVILMVGEKHVYNYG